MICIKPLSQMSLALIKGAKDEDANQLQSSVTRFDILHILQRLVSLSMYALISTIILYAI